MYEIKKYHIKKRHAVWGISSLLVFPIFVMIIAGMFSTYTNQQKGITISQNPIIVNGTQTICIAGNNIQCPGSITYTNSNLSCDQFNLACQLVCYIDGNSSNACIARETGGQVSVLNGQVLYPPSIESVIFGAFTPNNPEGYIGILIVGGGAILLIGFVIFGSGLNAASIYIAFLLFGYIGLWLVLSSLAGDVFISMPIITDSNGTQIATGSVFYSLLTLMYTLGILQRLG